MLFAGSRMLSQGVGYFSRESDAFAGNRMHLQESGCFGGESDAFAGKLMIRREGIRGLLFHPFGAEVIGSRCGSGGEIEPGVSEPQEVFCRG